jgi:demethylmenaquinone methyltransferase/2-methoxy-6-polyprenyl-1,4-benzoquinol methylase
MSPGVIQIMPDPSSPQNKLKLARKRFYLSACPFNLTTAVNISTAPTLRNFYVSAGASTQLIAWLEENHCDTIYCRALTSDEARCAGAEPVKCVPEFQTAHRNALSALKGNADLALRMITNYAPLSGAKLRIGFYEARAAEYDDWYLRRGRYERGPIHDAAWNAELDAAGRWLDGLPIHGEIVDLAAGTGWWSTLLAGKGELSLYDANAAPLERARDRLLAHGLRAHLHVRDAWAEPDREVDVVFTSFWLSHVPRPRLAAFLALVGRWLKPGGRIVFIDSLPDPQSSAADHPTPSDDRSVRRLDDGREFTIVKVYYSPDELMAALEAAGFSAAAVTTTGRFFLLGSATRTG